MRVLMICNKPPFPSNDGGSLAMLNTINLLLSQGVEVKVLAIDTPKTKTSKQRLQPFSTLVNYESIYIDTSVTIIGAFLNLFSYSSYHITRFYSKKMERRIAEILQEAHYDIVQLESLYVAPYLDVVREYSSAKVILRSHNVEFAIWEQIALSTPIGLKRTYLSLLAQRLKQFEKSFFNRVDGVLSITNNDMEMYQELGCLVPMTEVSFGVDIVAYSPVDKPTEDISFFHIGSMDWMPNQEAVRWFVSTVWNRVPIKQTKLYLAGKNMPPEFFKIPYKNIVNLGEVEDAIAFMLEHDVMVVPLHAGSGLRIKIIEAMALGKTVISTTIGAAGIDYVNNKNILIANTQQEFIHAITKCINQPQLVKEIGQQARELIVSKYNNEIVIAHIMQFYAHLGHSPLRN